MDDLSFEEFEIEYKYLKAVIEGGLEKKAGQHPRSMQPATDVILFGRNQGISWRWQTMKICIPPILCRRSSPWFTVFGVRIYFGAPNKKEFQNIVTTLAERYGVTMPAEELLTKANAWELSRRSHWKNGAAVY